MNNSMHTRCPQDAGNAFCSGTDSWRNGKFGNKSETNGYGVPVLHKLLLYVLGVNDAQRTPAPSVGEVVLLCADICCSSLRWVTFPLLVSGHHDPLSRAPRVRVVWSIHPFLLDINEHGFLLLIFLQKKKHELNDAKIFVLLISTVFPLKNNVYLTVFGLELPSGTSGKELDC